MRTRAPLHSISTARPAHRCWVSPGSHRAFSLLELIGVLAILAILAATVLPLLIKQTDQAVATQESANLQSFGDAFQRSVTGNRRIPGVSGSDWATNVATQL